MNVQLKATLAIIDQKMNTDLGAVPAQHQGDDWQECIPGVWTRYYAYYPKDRSAHPRLYMCQFTVKGQILILFQASPQSLAEPFTLDQFTPLPGTVEGPV